MTIIENVGTPEVPHVTSPREVARALRAVNHTTPIEIVVTRELWALIDKPYRTFLATRDNAPRAALRRWRREIEPICRKLEAAN